MYVYPEQLLHNVPSYLLQDSYRIVRFCADDELEKPIPVELPHIDRLNGARDDFLRAHFFWSLGVEFYGGDISEDFDSFTVDFFMSKMRVSGFIQGESTLEHYERAVPFDDDPESDWNTELGLQVRAWLCQKDPLSWEEMIAQREVPVSWGKIMARREITVTLLP